jgi:hypothetical protein
VQREDPGSLCAIYHRPDLKGIDEVPYLTGRSPMYVFVSSTNIKVGTRSGPSAE